MRVSGGLLALCLVFQPGLGCRSSPINTRPGPGFSKLQIASYQALQEQLATIGQQPATTGQQKQLATRPGLGAASHHRAAASLHQVAEVASH